MSSGDEPGKMDAVPIRLRRRRPRLRRDLEQQLAAVEPSRDRRVEYRPCVVTLNDGSRQDGVYLCEAGTWFDYWGVDLEDDRGKRLVPIQQVEAIEASASYSQCLYEAASEAT